MNEFSIEEFQTLRKEIEIHRSDLSSLERYCLFSVAACFTWFSTETLEGVFILAWILPPTLVIFCAARSWTIKRRLGYLSAYIIKIEEHHYPQENQLRGWERYQNSINPKRPTLQQNGYMGFVTQLYWLALFCCSTLAAIFGIWGQLPL